MNILAPGISTICFDKDETPEDYLPEYKAFGVKWAELSLNCLDMLGDEARFERLRALLDENDVKVWSIHSRFGDAFDISSASREARYGGIEDILLCLKRAGQLKAKCVVIHPSSSPIEEAERPARTDNFRESLRILEEGARSVDVPLAVELLPNTNLGRTSGELLSIIEGFDEEYVGICLDVGHACMSEDPVDATRRLGRRTIALHVSDNDGEDDLHWLPGRGVIAWQAWVRCLVEVGYDGTFMYESHREFAKELSAGERVEAMTVNATDIFRYASEPGGA